MYYIMYIWNIIISYEVTKQQHTDLQTRQYALREISKVG